jgi:lambda family phage minor tail protein L
VPSLIIGDSGSFVGEAWVGGAVTNQAVSNLQSLAPGTIVDMFSIDATAYGLGLLNYSPETNALGNDVVWQGVTYVRFPVIVDGYQKSSQGSLPRPTMTLGNVGGILSPLLKAYNSLLGCKVTRRRTLSKYLDPVNFSGGVNPTADPNSHFPDEAYFIDRKSGESALAIQFELAVAWDVTGVKLPLRQVIRDSCQYTYRSAECSYIGGAVAKVDDSATANIGEDRCSKTRVGCTLRFGVNNPLPASFFPSVGLIR